MIDGQKILALIPARGGSKGVPRKNVREVGGRPLLAWSIDAARASRYVDRVVLSSDDAEISAVARQSGCEVPFVRPANLALDETPGVDPVIHALTNLKGYDIVVLLQPTSPLRIAEDIDMCLEQLNRCRAPSCVSICEAECHPYLVFECLADSSLRSFVTDRNTANIRRQDFPAAWRLNGAVYAARVNWLLNSRSFVGDGTVSYRMPVERSLDIDSFEDLKVADALLSAK